MNTIRQVPFQSLRKLREWERSLGTEDWAKSILIPGMRTHFKNPNPVLRVYDDGEFDENTYYVDVHLELTSKDGTIHQPWVLSFISQKGLTRENSYARKRGLEPLVIPTLKDLDNPFPGYDIIWECQHFTEDETVKAVKAWCDKFWPDWEPQVVFEKSDQNDWLQELLREIFLGESIEKGLTMTDLNLYIFKCSNSEEFEEWLRTQKSFSFIDTNEGLVLWCSEEFRDEILNRFPGTTCEIFTV